ncbi:MAG: NuoM family protein [Dehalococcoidia bacterium]
MLTTIVFLPLAGALVIVVLLREARYIRIVAAAIVIADLLLALGLFGVYDPGGARFQMVEQYQWIAPLKVQYYLGVDGLSLPLVLLTTLLGVCAVLISWNITRRVKEYFVWLLVLQTAVLGVFTALDFVLFFIFWELELLPMYLLIAIWGTGRKEYSAMKFVIFTILGSAFMLVSLIVLYISLGTFDITHLIQQGGINPARLIFPSQAIFFFLFVAFAVKLPVWPIHTWLPDAHTDAPTAVSVILAGVLLKLGGYGLIRFNVNMFPDLIRDYSWLLVTLAVINVLYGAMVTLRQTDLKRLIAYSSISHMGLVLLGIASVGGALGVSSSLGLTGASLQMFTHGTITGLLFMLVGLVYDRAHTRYIPDLGGLASRMPYIAAVFLVAGLASLGLPGFSGFVAEILVFLGTFPVWSWPTAFAAFGIVLTTGYILWMIQRVLFGPQLRHFAHLGDARVVEAVPLALMVVAIVVVGFYPALLTDVFDAGLLPVLARFG